MTPLSRTGAALTTGQANSGAAGNITCTLVHVQPFNAAAKQHIAPKAGSSPNKQTLPVQLQKLVPISVATTSLGKIQTGTAPQFTVAAPAVPVSNVRHIAPKVNIVPAAVPTGQTVQLTTPTIQVRNIAPAEKTAQIPQQVYLDHKTKGNCPFINVTITVFRNCQFSLAIVKPTVGGILCLEIPSYSTH